MTRSTLREINGFEQTPAGLADATVILVDYQNTYTRGVMELEGWEPALTAAESLLGRARAAGATVIHVINDGGPGTPYDVRAEIGAIHDRVAPVDGERIVVKSAPNAFVGTELGDLVDAAGNAQVVIAGFMTHMCVAYTAEGAFLRGDEVTVVADACATRPLSSSVAAVTARQLHESALAGIGDLYAVVVPSVGSLR